MKPWAKAVSAVLLITTATLPASLVAVESASLNRPLDVTVELSALECRADGNVVFSATGSSGGFAAEAVRDAIPSCEVDWTAAVTGCTTCFTSVMFLVGGAWAVRAAHLGMRLAIAMTRGQARAAMFAAGFTFAGVLSQLLPGCRGCFSATCVRELVRGVMEAIEQLFTSPLWSCANADVNAELECLIGINDDGEIEY